MEFSCPSRLKSEIHYLIAFGLLHSIKFCHFCCKHMQARPSTIQGNRLTFFFALRLVELANFKTMSGKKVEKNPHPEWGLNPCIVMTCRMPYRFGSRRLCSWPVSGVEYISPAEMRHGRGKMHTGHSRHVTHGGSINKTRLIDGTLTHMPAFL